MISALAPDRPDQALNISFLPGRAERWADPGCPSLARELKRTAKCPVIVANEILRCVVPGEGLRNLAPQALQILRSKTVLIMPSRPVLRDVRVGIAWRTLSAASCLLRLLKKGSCRYRPRIWAKVEKTVSKSRSPLCGARLAGSVASRSAAPAGGLKIMPELAKFLV
jgi:hypothetical protein